ncbi:MAG TPA: type VI secretion system baseplate subunit TssK [Burkholderiales bacterium]|jgi:type VI secretion system protein ImpJ|nr:type VI secretion system baseplate subunit TssK [Burkholderiales bacterium]
MSQHNRVVWAEGLFLRPQHFQQAERYFERLMSQRLDSLAPYAAGFTRLQIDQELLKIGKVGLVAAEGVFPDGTPFNIPFEADIPEPFDVPGDVRDRLVVVTLPLRRAGMAELAFERSGDSSLVRYLAADHEIRDSVLEMESSAQLKIGRLNVRLQLDGEATSAHTALGVVRVVEKRADGRVVLDDGYVPPCLDCRVSGRLQDYVKELHGLVRHRINALADRVSSPGAKGVADVSDFLLLQLCNRYEPLLAHFLTRSSLHPELFYRSCLELAGEIATYARRERMPASFSTYRQDDLQNTFMPVIEEIRRGLTAVIEQNAVAIPVMDRGRGVFAGTVPDVELLRNAVFVLAVGANVAPESLRLHFPTQVKIGPPERIRDLVVSHLPGIQTTPLPVAPRQIPYHAGYSYFELDRKNDFWKALEASRVIAMHVAGDFPGLSLELWAIRD